MQNNMNISVQQDAILLYVLQGQMNEYLTIRSSADQTNEANRRKEIHIINNQL